MDEIKLASDILRKVAVDLAVDKSFYAIDGRGYGSAEIVELADRLAALALIRSPDFAGLVEEVEEVGDWRSLGRAVACEGAKSFGLTDVPDIWPNPWRQEVAMVAYAIHQARERADAAEAKLAAMEADAGRYHRVYAAARGLCHGSDWNQGTHSNVHGYRQQLIDAVQAIDAARGAP